jgi:uncharacterized protein YcbX
MKKHQVGVVADVFRYPVKSMLGERLDETAVGEKGVVGDRAWALREANGRIVSAKRWSTMFEFRAAYDSPPKPGELAPVTIELADGCAIHAEDAGASDVLSAALGRKVTLDRVRDDEHSRAEIDPGTVFGDLSVEKILPAFTAATLPDSFGLTRGTFFDSATIHVIASGSLAHMRSLIGGDAQLDPRRFRPNIVIETDPRLTGFVEDGWLGGTLEVGAQVKIIALQSALRCVMTTHRQTDLARDMRILRTAAQHHQAKLGLFASIGAPGTVRVGDPVWLAI